MTPPLQKNFHTANPETESAIDRSIPEFEAAKTSDEDEYFKIINHLHIYQKLKRSTRIYQLSS